MWLTCVLVTCLGANEPHLCLIVQPQLLRVFFLLFNVAVKALWLYQDCSEIPCCVKGLAAPLHHVAQIPPEVRLQSSRSSTDVTPQT